MPMTWTPRWPSSIPTSSTTPRSSRALRERQLPSEVMTACESNGGSTGEAWERLTNRPQEFRDLGESVLVLGQMDFTARTTGIEFTQELGQVAEVARREDRSRPRLSDPCPRPSKPPG